MKLEIYLIKANLMKHNAQFNVRRSVEKLEKKVALNCSFKI